MRRLMYPGMAFAPEVTHTLPSPLLEKPTYRIPALAVTTSGRLIATCDLRPSFHDLPGQVSIIYRTSDDEGRTWDDARLLMGATEDWGYGDPSLVALADGSLMCLYVGSKGLSFWDDGGPAAGLWQMRMAVSGDDGKSWEHRDITGSLLGEHPTISSAFFSSGNGIELSTRRILNPIVWHGEGERLPRVSMAMSDDGGSSWLLSSPIPGTADETKVVELPDGSLIASIRAYPNRLTSVSTDHGMTWSEPTPTIQDPGCNGGLTLWNGRYALTLPQPHLATTVTDEVLGDASGGRSVATLQDWSARRHLCLLTGPDPEHLSPEMVLDDGPAAYSASAVLSNGELAVAWEHGNYREIRLTLTPADKDRS